MKIKEIIKGIIKKVKKFNLLVCLLNKKMKRVDDKIVLNKELIEYYENVIEAAEVQITDSDNMIKDCRQEIILLEKEKKDIKKLT